MTFLSSQAPVPPGRVEDREGCPVWLAPDGTEWIWHQPWQTWTGWQPGENGQWTRTVREFRRSYPDAPDWDSPDDSPLLGTRVCSACGRRLFAHCDTGHWPPCCPGKCPGRRPRNLTSAEWARLFSTGGSSP